MQGCKRPREGNAPPPHGAHLKRGRSGWIATAEDCQAGGASGSSPCGVSPGGATKSEAGSDEQVALADDVDRMCLGCGRTSKFSLAYFAEGGKVIFVYETPRGSWCKDCYNVWRTMRKSTMPLTVFDIHLKRRPENHLEHMRYIMAYVSLRFENALRVSREALEARKLMLDFVCRALGVPFGPMVATPRLESEGLSDISADEFPLMLKGNSGAMELLILRPLSHADQVQTTAQACHLARCEHRQQPLFPIVFCSNEQDSQWVSGEGGRSSSSSSTGPGGAVVKSEADEELALSSPGALPIKKKVDECKLATTAVLTNVVSANPSEKDWGKTSQKALKLHLTRIMKHRADLIKCPFPRFIDDVDEMLVATKSGQVFVREAGAYLKRFTNLKAMTEAAAPLKQWVDKHKCGVHPQVLALLLKGEVCSAMVVGDVEKAVEILHSSQMQRLATDFARERCSAAKVSYAELLEEWVVSGLVQMFLSWEEEKQTWGDNLRDQLTKCLVAIAALFQRLRADDRADVGDLTAMVKALQTIAAVGSSGVVSSGVAEAMSTMESKFAKQMRSGMLDTTVGQAMWAAATALCAVGAMDSHSFDLLAMGANLLCNEIVPIFKEEEGSWVIQLSEVANGRVASLLEEGLSNVMESTAQWSSAGMEASASIFAEFYVKLHDLLRVLNACEWFDVQELSGMFKYSEGDLLELKGGDVAHGELVAFMRSLAESAMATLPLLAKHGYKRGAFCDVLSRVDDAALKVEKLIKVAPTMGDAATALLGRVPKLLADARSRESMRLELEDLCKLVQSPPPEGPEALVAEVQSKGMLKSSVGIACGMILQRKAAPPPDDFAFSFEFCAEFGEENDSYHGDKPSTFDAQDLERFHKANGIGHPVAVFLSEHIVHQSFVSVLDLWAKHCQASLCLAWPGACNGQAVKVALCTAIGANAFDELAKAMGKNIASRGAVAGAMERLDCALVSEVLRNMVRVMPTSTLADLSWLPGATIESKVDKFSYDKLVEFFTKGAQALAVGAWVTQRWVEEKQNVTLSRSLGSGVVAHTLEPMLLEGVARLRAMLIELAGDAQQDAGEDQAPTDPKKEIAEGSQQLLAPFKALMNLLLQHWFPKLAQVLASSLLNKLAMVAQASAALTPNWKYFIDDNKYNQSLAKTTLLTEACRAKLPDQVEAHFGYAASMGEAFGRWGLGSPAECEGSAKEVAKSQAILEHATETVDVVVATSIVEEMTPAQQGPAAARFLDQPLSASFPAALKKKVAALKTKGV